MIKEFFDRHSLAWEYPLTLFGLFCLFVLPVLASGVIHCSRQDMPFSECFRCGGASTMESMGE